MIIHIPPLFQCFYRTSIWFLAKFLLGQLLWPTKLHAILSSLTVAWSFSGTFMPLGLARSSHCG